MTTHNIPAGQTIEEVMQHYVAGCQHYLELPTREKELENYRIKYNNEVADVQRKTTSARTSAKGVFDAIDELNRGLVSYLELMNLKLPTYEGQPSVSTVSQAELEKQYQELRHSKNTVDVLLNEINAIVRFYSNIKLMMYIILLILVLVIVLILTGNIKLSSFPNADLMSLTNATATTSTSSNSEIPTISVDDVARTKTAVFPTATAEPAPNVEIQAIISSSQGANSRDNAGNTLVFDPQNMLDGDFKTAWRTSVRESQIITMTLASISNLETIEFTPGWVYTDTAPVQDRFILNYQITEFELVLYDESLVSEDAQFSYYNPVCIISQQIEVPQRDYYVVDLNTVDCTQNKDKPIRYVVLKVISVVKPEPNSKNFVAISDIRITGR